MPRRAVAETDFCPPPALPAPQVRLVSAIISHGGGEPFLSRFLALLVGVIKRDADALGTLFNARPYMRILAGLLVDLGTSEAQEAPWGGPRLLRCLALALHALQPISVPGFAFAWLELVAHRALMPRLLAPQAAPQGAALYEVSNRARGLQVGGGMQQRCTRQCQPNAQGR